MKNKDLFKLSNEEKAQKVKELQKELFDLKFKFKLGQSKNSALITKTKRDIARLKTYKSLEEKNG